MGILDRWFRSSKPPLQRQRPPVSPQFIPQVGPANFTGAPPYGPAKHSEWNTQALEQADREAVWFPVTSSNVDAIRWVEGNPYPLQVRFKPSGRESFMRVYGYIADRDVFRSFIESSSKGRFVKQHLIDAGVPYGRLF